MGINRQQAQAQQQQPLAIEPDYREESVSAGRFVFAGATTLAPEQFDRELPKFSYKMARLMRLDAEIHAAIEFLVDAICSDDLQFNGACFDTDPEYAESEEIKEFLARCLLEAPSTPFIPVLKELIRGAILGGHKVAEIVAREEQFGKDTGRLVLDKLKVKPRRATAFVVDEFLNVVGLVGIKRNQYSLNNYGSMAAVTADNIIPKNKFFICVLEQEDSDPRGISQIKAAMKPFLDKQETRQQFSIWRKKCAIRSFIGEAPLNPTPLSVLDSNGQPVLVNGVPKTISATQSIANTLARMQNDTVGVFPNGTNVTPLDADGTGAQFKLSYDLNNAEIRKSILLQTMATGDADKAGLGSQGHVTHERILGRRVKSFRAILTDQIYDLCRTFVALNFGEDKVHLTARPDFGEFDKSTLEGKLQNAVAAGYSLDQSQFSELDSEFNYPERAADWMEQAQARQQKAAVMPSPENADVNPATNPTDNGNQQQKDDKKDA